MHQTQKFPNVLKMGLRKLNGEPEALTWRPQFKGQWPAASATTPAGEAKGQMEETKGSYKASMSWDKVTSARKGLCS